MSYRDSIIQVHRSAEFLEEDLELLHGNCFTTYFSVTLDENLKFTKSFLIQEYLRRPPRRNAYNLFDIMSTVSQLLESADNCVIALRNLKLRWVFFMEIFRLARLSLKFHSLVKEIRCIYYEDVDGFGGNGSQGQYPLMYSSMRGSDCRISMGETMVGFDDEAQRLLDRLIGGGRQLEVDSIVGMAGIGKTTLAKRLYNDQFVVYGFHIRVWVSISQVNKKANVLSNILSSILGQKVSIASLDDTYEIGEKLYRCLKGNRYLIVIDDIWEIGVWNDIKMYFPNDCNKSRILITTRIRDVALSIQGNNNVPHFLRFLSPEESWHLFNCKVFADKSCPRELMKIGKKIVAKCKGLPLAIVLVAGLLLKKQRTQEFWTLVADNIGSLVDSDTEQMMGILTLSYEHLPQHLKLCFVYLATFPEDHEISVKELMRSWIAEGLIQKTGERRLEDLAEDYLVELINRSLVIVAKTRSNGGTKTCLIHDTLRELCLRKANGEKSLMMPISLCLLKTVTYEHLRKLDLTQIVHPEFPVEILKLYHLKYLALQVEHIKILPRRLSMLWNLETFILQRDKGRKIVIPYQIWEMEKLRHIDISGEIVFEPKPAIRLPWRYPLKTTWDSFVNVSCLHHLQTLSHLRISASVIFILARTPNLRKLGFHLSFSNKNRDIFFPYLASLKLLESLKFEYQTLGMMTRDRLMCINSIRIPYPRQFPPNLRKLTLIGSHLRWEQMSTIGKLPKLEVLKIKDNFFSGPIWETSEGGFRCLKFFKLSHMDLQQWITSECDHFPKLEQLVLNACFDLQEIPSAFGDICTLEVIKVYKSSSSVSVSAWQIQESQRGFSNDGFKVFVYPHLEENIQV